MYFPGLRGVLNKHYQVKGIEDANQQKTIAYDSLGHFHFYCEEALELVCKTIGFDRIEFQKYGKSNYPELRDLDTRIKQVNLNIYADVIKPDFV